MKITLADIVKKTPLIIISLSLGVHLWFSNSQLLAKTSGPEYENIWAVVAVAYSLIGAVSVLTTKEVIPILIFGSMDGFAIYFKINPPIDYNHTIGIFYGLYTGYIVFITWKMANGIKLKDIFRRQEEPKPQEQKAITEEVKAIEPTPQLTQTACMNKVKGMLKGGPTPEKREKAVQLCMMLSIEEQPQMMNYINEKLPE